MSGLICAFMCLYQEGASNAPSVVASSIDRETNLEDLVSCSDWKRGFEA